MIGVQVEAEEDAAWPFSLLRHPHPVDDTMVEQPSTCDMELWGLWWWGGWVGGGFRIGTSGDSFIF